MVHDQQLSAVALARRKNALIGTTVQIVTSLIGIGVGIRAYVMTTNIKAGAFWSHLVMLLAASFMVAGLCLKLKGRSKLAIGILLNSIGVLMSFVALLLEGSAANHVAKTDFSECSYSKHDVKLDCFGQNSNREDECIMRVHKHSCFCCTEYKQKDCVESTYSFSSRPSIYTGVDSCGRVKTEYQMLLWISMVLNIIQFGLGVLNSGLVAHYRKALQEQSARAIRPMIMGGPSIITAGSGPVIIYNQNTVAYQPAIVKPPDYSEVVEGDQNAPLPPYTAPNAQAEVTNNAQESRSSNQDSNPKPSESPQSPPPPYVP